MDAFLKKKPRACDAGLTGRGKDTRYGTTYGIIQHAIVKHDIW